MYVTMSKKHNAMPIISSLFGDTPVHTALTVCLSIFVYKLIPLLMAPFDLNL